MPMIAFNPKDINQKNEEGENALLLCDYGSYDIAEDYHYEKPDMVEFLIDNGVEGNVKDKEGNTPLIKACYGNNISIIRKLLKAGAKVNVKNNKGETPIIVVAKNNGLSLVLLMLVEAGADINERNEYGENIFEQNTSLYLIKKQCENNFVTDIYWPMRNICSIALKNFATKSNKSISARRRPARTGTS